WLEGGARLSPCLRHPVEVAVLEVETAHHGLRGTVLGAQGHHGGLHGGLVDDAPIAVQFVHIYDRPSTDAYVILSTLNEPDGNDLQRARAGDLHNLLGGARPHTFLWRARQQRCREQTVVT